MITFEKHPTEPGKLLIKTQKYYICKYTEEDLQAAVLSEREACAKLCDEMAERLVDDGATGVDGAGYCAAMIRERMK